MLSIQDMIWKTEECCLSKKYQIKNIVVKIPILLLFTVFLSLLFLIICALIDGFRSIYIVLARFRWFQIILARSSLQFLVEKWEHQSVKESFGKSFSFPFSVKCFDRNFKCFLYCTLPFFNVVKFEDSKHIKRYIFITFSLTITKRGGICILKECLLAYVAYEDLLSV